MKNTISNNAKMTLAKPRTTAAGSEDGRRVKQSSFAAVVTDLAIGESAMKHLPVGVAWTMSQIREYLAEWREKHRESIASTVRLAKTRTGGKYNVELADLFTPSGRLFIVAIVTRTE